MRQYETHVEHHKAKPAITQLGLMIYDVTWPYSKVSDISDKKSLVLTSSHFTVILVTQIKQCHLYVLRYNEYC